MGGTLVTLRQEVVVDLMKKTEFNHAEICDLYRQYRLDTQDTKLTVDEEYFRSMYQKVFPDGAANTFADLVYGTFPTNEDGQVDFQQYILNLSAPLKGTQHEKNEWLFNFFDLDRDGVISQAEMTTVIQAVNNLNAGLLYATRHVTETQMVDYVFQTCTEHSSLNKGDFMTAAIDSTTLKYVLEGTMSAILSPYVMRKARTGSFGKARSNSVISVRKSSRSSSSGEEFTLG